MSGIPPYESRKERNARYRMRAYLGVALAYALALGWVAIYALAVIR